MLQELLDALGVFQNRLKSHASVHVNDQKTKADAIGLANAYFRDVRPHLTELLGDEQNFRGDDEAWQALVRLAQTNSKRQSYLKLVKRLTARLRELNVQLVSRVAERRGSTPGVTDLTQAERQLLSTLDALLPTAAASYRQGLLDLQDSQRLSYRGTASEFREALRETLDHLAPDTEVMKQPGFKTEDNQTRPTMRQKARFVLLSRGRSKTQAAATEKSIGVVEGVAGEAVRATYDRASLATHLETSRAEVIRIKRYVDAILFDLLEIKEPPVTGRVVAQ